MSPEPITPFVVFSDDRMSAVLHWDRKNAGANYRIYRTDKQNLQDFVLIQEISTLNIDGEYDYHYADGMTTALDPTKQYYYKVAAVIGGINIVESIAITADLL